ncbi:MAG: hypothetical protein ACREX9_14365 [Gammaproteobacteria bacterium]
MVDPVDIENLDPLAVIRIKLSADKLRSGPLISGQDHASDPSAVQDVNDLIHPGPQRIGDANHPYPYQAI